MRTLARSRGITLGLVAGCALLAAGCAGRHTQGVSPDPSQPKPQGTADRPPVTPGVIVIVTDETGALLGALSLPNPVPDSITIKKEDLVPPQNIENVKPEKTFLAPGVQTITIFTMGDPCQYVIQGGRAVRRCW